MKKLILALLCITMTLVAHAELRYQSLDNFHGKTTVVLVDTKWEKGTTISNARFNNDGKTYDAKTMVIEEKGKTLTVTMTFKRLTVFRNVSVTLELDNKEVKIPIDLALIAFKEPTSYTLRLP